MDQRQAGNPQKDLKSEISKIRIFFMKGEILYLHIKQPYAQYRNPFTFYYAQTYPLPPKSTVLGMIQNALETLEIPEIEVSICGKYETIFYHYSRFIKGRRIFWKNGCLWVEQEIKHKTIREPLYYAQRAPLYHSELLNVEVMILIKGKNELLTEIKESLENCRKILSLGRAHDLAFIRVGRASVSKKKVEDFIEFKSFNFLIPETYIETLGIRGRLVFLMPKKIEYRIDGNYLYSIALTPQREEIRRKVHFEKVYYFEGNRKYKLPEGEVKEIEYTQVNGLNIPLFWW